jgi:hypothetical protein
MAEHSSWADLQDRRMAEPGEGGYNAALLAYELGHTVRQLREARGRSQTELAEAAAMTQLQSPDSRPPAPCRAGPSSTGSPRRWTPTWSCR